MRGETFDELLEVATKCVFGCVAEFVALIDIIDVLFGGHVCVKSRFN